MPESGDWSWLGELPPAWEPPDELRAPTKFTYLNLAVMLLRSEIIGNDLLEQVGILLAEWARFEVWIAQAQPPKSFREKLLLSQLKDSGIRSVYDAWVVFSATFVRSGGLQGTYEKERVALSGALRSAIADLQAAARG